MEPTATPKGLAFREYPLIVTLLYEKAGTEAARLLLLLELLRDELHYHQLFDLKEIGH